MRKAVAIPYVIALILGIIAIGLLGYWFISQGGKTIASGTKSECDAKTFNYCLAWQNLNNCNENTHPNIETCGTAGKPNCLAIGFCK